MAKTTFQWVRDDEEQLHLAEYRPSRSNKRKIAIESDALVEALLVAPASVLKTLTLSDKTWAALREVKAVRPNAHGARRRLTLGLSALLREEDHEQLSAALGLSEDSGGVTAHDLQMDVVERWRSRLLTEGDEALAELLDEHPTGDRQRLRQLTNNARRDEAANKRGKPYKQLFAALRELLSGDSGSAG